MLNERRCIICGETYSPRTHNQKTCSKDCREQLVKQRRKERYIKEKNKQKDYYKQNEEHYQQYRKDYYQKNKERIKKYSEDYRKENREKVNSYYREYHKKNREKILATREQKTKQKIDDLFDMYMECLDYDFPQEQQDLYNMTDIR